MTVRPRGAELFLLMILCAAALGCDANRTPTGPTPSPTVATPASTIAVRVEGRVIDGDREAPVPGAIITLAEVTADGRYQQPNQPAPQTGADDDGMFVLTLDLAPRWRNITLEVTRDGYDSTRIYVTPTEVMAADVRVLPTLTIRPGESLDMRVFLGSYVCSDESHLCRRILIESSGESIDIEVVAAGADRDVGLVVGPTVNHPIYVRSYQRRVTVSGGEVWVYPARAEHTGVSSGTGMGVFEQAVRLTAYRH